MRVFKSTTLSGCTQYFEVFLGAVCRPNRGRATG